VEREHKNYGDFIDLVRKTEVTEAQSFFAEWDSLASGETAETDFSTPLTRELVLAFAYDVACYFTQRISRVCTEALHATLSKAGYDFQKEIYVKANNCCINVGMQEIRMPLRMVDAMIERGAIRGIRRQS
jgi:hypothetical protein